MIKMTAQKKDGTHLGLSHANLDRLRADASSRSSAPISASRWTCSSRPGRARSSGFARFIGPDTKVNIS